MKAKIIKLIKEVADFMVNVANAESGAKLRDVRERK